MEKTKVVYIAHPVGGDVFSNLKKISNITREILTSGEGVIPVAPYFLYCHALNDNIEKERELGMQVSTSYLLNEIVDEVWLYGDRISEGMMGEILLAETLEIEVKACTQQTKSAYDDYKSQSNKSDIIYSIEDEEDCRLIINSLNFMANKKLDTVERWDYKGTKEEAESVIKKAKEYSNLGRNIQEKLTAKQVHGN